MAKIPIIRTVTAPNGDTYWLKYSQERGTFFAVLNQQYVKYPQKVDNVTDEQSALKWIDEMINPTQKEKVTMDPTITTKEDVVFNKEQQEAFDLIVKGIGNVLITGNAGTGKSFVINHAVKALGAAGKRVEVCSTTAISATAINGKTFHKAFKIFPKYKDAKNPWTLEALLQDTVRSVPDKATEAGKAFRSMMKYTDVVIIDEVSMMQIVDLIRLEHQMRTWGPKKNQPYGGIRMIFVGDFLQLEPVVTANNPISIPAGKSAYAFDSDRAWKNAGIQTVQLTQIVRQKEVLFGTFLNNIRLGIWHPWMQEIVDECKARKLNEEMVPRFYSRNDKVNKINEMKMAELPGPEYSWTSADKNPDKWDTKTRKYVKDYSPDKWDKDCLALNVLKLKKGALVICLQNNPNTMIRRVKSSAINGDTGIVVGFHKHVVDMTDETGPQISSMAIERELIVNGQELMIPIVRWTRLDKEEIMWFSFFSQGDENYRWQIPIKPAWAMTIHKAQGMTLDAAIVDVSDCFATGQTYVALSRVRTLEGLVIEGFDKSKVKANDAALDFYNLKGNYEGDEQEGPGEGNQGAKPIQPNKPNNGGSTMNNNPETHRWIATDEDTIRCANCDCRYGGKQHEQKCNSDIQPDMNPKETKKENKITMHTKKTPMFKQEQYEFLSNMYPCDIDGYKCVESFYQAMKSKDPAVRASIKQMDGRNAKSAGKNHVIVREDWESIKLKVMRYALEKKFAAGTELAAKLVATGHTVLVESNWWHDNFWGDCYCQKCESIKGENHLGKMLMEIRDNLRNGGGGTPTNEPIEPTNNQKEQEKEVTPEIITESQVMRIMNPDRMQEIREVSGLMANREDSVNQIHILRSDDVRIITNIRMTDIDTNIGYEVVPNGPYSFAFLEHFFGIGGYRMEVRKHGGRKKVTYHETEINDKVAIRWSNATAQYTLFLGNNYGWLDGLKNIGLVFGNSKKMSKRMQELVRQTGAFKYFDKLKIETMDPAQIGVDEKFVDGISAISQSFAVSLYRNNTAAGIDWIESHISDIVKGKTTVVSLRIMTPSGLIKGNAIILPDKMMNGHDVRTFTPNVKSELATNGWFWATIEPSYGRLPMKTDDLTLAIYHRIKGIIDPEMMLEAFKQITDDSVDKTINGDPNEWMREVANWSAVDEDNLNKKSLIKKINGLVDKLSEIGLSIESSQLLMYLKAREFGMHHGVLDRAGKSVAEGYSFMQDNGTWMPVPYAYRAHIMTREALEIFGFKFKNKTYEGFYHDKTHCFVVPGDFFVANYVNHGGYDLDDTINVMIRQITTKDGTNSLCAILMRNPNDFAEWSEIPVSPHEVEYCYHQVGDIPTVSWEELNEKVPKLSDLLANNEITYQFTELPGASTIVLENEYGIGDEIRNRRAATALPGGTGATVLPKIIYYAVVGTFISDQLVSNEQLIDAVQQGMATNEDMKLIKQASEDIYVKVKNWLVDNQPTAKIDAYWASTRIPAPVNQKHKLIDPYTPSYAETNAKSLLTGFLFKGREEIARAHYQNLLAWSNTPHKPSKLDNLNDPDMGKVVVEFNKLLSKYYQITDDGTTADWARYFVELLKKSDEVNGEDYTNRKILRLWRHCFELKRVKPMANHDKWLFVVNAQMDELPIDWLIRAYKSLT